MRGTDKKWWEVVDGVVKEYNEKHVSRNTLMTPKEAATSENRGKVKTQLDSIKKTDAPHPRLEPGDKVRVVSKNKFEKGYMPDWSDEVYTVCNKLFRNNTALYAATVEALEQLGWLDTAQREALQPWRAQPIINARGISVGARDACFRLQTPA
jgi:hypothetical protein